MNIPFISSLFKKKNKLLSVPDTILIKRIKNLSNQSNLLVFKDVNIYHHTEVYKVPLLVLDDLRGLYIFETKEWTFDELKNASIEKAEAQESSSQTLAFDNTQNIIKKKFNELTHNDGVPLFNYLLMENLNRDEYEHLNDSFKNLLPQNKIIFSDSSQADIFKKLQNASQENHNLPSVDAILGTLLIQYALLDNENELHLLTQEQRAFIDAPLESINYLNGVPASGKSNLLLLKSLVELLNKTAKKIVIIKPTVLSCDLLKKRLLDIVEHAIIELDLTAIEIMTPLELLNRHQQKLKRSPMNSFEIDSKLMRSSFTIADIIMCDDVHLMPDGFIAYLQNIQKKSTLLLVNDAQNDVLNLNYDYKKENRKIRFYNSNPHAKSMHLIASYLEDTTKSVLVVCNSLSSEKLKEDLNSFVKEEAITLDSSTHLLNQNFTRLSFCHYSDTNELKADHVILMDLCFVSENEIEYALNLSTSSTDILYEEDCQEIVQLRDKHESRKE